jgi:hypothetical protein
MKSLSVGRIENHPVASLHLKVVGGIRIRIRRIAVEFDLGKIIESITVGIDQFTERSRRLQRFPLLYPSTL